jgi:hypothetical protein
VAAQKVDMTGREEQAATRFVAAAQRLRDAGAVERALIENLTSHLRGMFTDGPAWVDEHIRDAEAQVRYAQAGTQRRAHIDNVVGYTTIEYEHDLRERAVFKEGLEQVRQHLAGMLNAGAPKHKLIGILSDTVSWRAMRIARVSGAPLHGPQDIELEEIEDPLELSTADPEAGERIRDFLARHLAREGARVLRAQTIVEDLGFQSAVAQRHLAALSQILADASTKRPAFARVVERLWSEFVGVGGDGGFDPAIYLSELYAVTLAKLICANAIEHRALHSSEDELQRILDGSQFQDKGLANLVEYDYFGWLHQAPYVQRIVPLAQELQRALRRFDFEAPAAEDLFGELMAQLAQRSQRLLLGQEYTPTWLARQMAAELLGGLQDGEQPRFLDMCCGSGPMIVEVLRLAKSRLRSGEDEVEQLRQVATGFDIDPLAVMLAKVNWVLAVREALPLDGSQELTIPIYHADSMFVKTPVNDLAGGPPAMHGLPSASYELRLGLGAHTVQMPAFLVAPERQALFDVLLAKSHRVAMAAAEEPVSAYDARSMVDEVIAEADAHAADGGATLTQTEREQVERFGDELVCALTALQRSELNGIWTFVLRNGYRPGLVAGQFNGLITNPPWLALSKLAENPYRHVLKRYAAAYGIQPEGSAHLHTELATTFLLQAVDRYLLDGSPIACVLPETVLNGLHHDRFRRGGFARSQVPVPLHPQAIWRVESGTFKNEAIVLLARKVRFSRASRLPGLTVSAQSTRPIDFDFLELGTVRSAWSDTGGVSMRRLFTDLDFRQGADLMPRTTVFHETAPRAGRQIHIGPIDPASGGLGYLISGAKKLQRFRIKPQTVQQRYVYNALLSAHLTPFELEGPVKALLPFTHDPERGWAKATPVSLAPHHGSSAAFREILKALTAEAKRPVSLSDYQEKLDVRRKLTSQGFPDQERHLVVFGAGGSKPTVAYAPLARLGCERLVIDQTLYFCVVEDEEQAIYLTGLFNSDALDRLLKPFQPKGAFTERHIHKLPTKVTPPYDPSLPLHREIVNATRDLIDEIAAARRDRWPTEWFNPNSPLNVRRPRVFCAIKQLESYPAYDRACARLYGV